MKVDVQLPARWNYLQLVGVGGSGVTIDIGMLSDAEIRRLGKEWTKALLLHAAKRRKDWKKV